MRTATGIDLHAKTAVCYTVYAGDGEPNEKEKAFLEDFNEKFRIQSSQPDDMMKIAEALKGHEAYVLIENSTKTFETYWVLTNLGINVIVAQPQDLYRITKSVKKTDKNDSVELAGYLRRYLHGEREFAVCTMPPKEWMIKRELCRIIFKEKQHLGVVKRRARAHLLMHGIKLSREYSDIFSKKAMKELIDTKDECLRLFVYEARSIKERTDFEANYIEYLFKDIRLYQLILSVPGFGRITAAYLTSMIMELDRFPNKNSLTAYFGIVPKMRESAETTHNCATTHRGDEEVRRLLMQAAFVHVNTVEYSVVKSMWNRLKSKGKAHREIQVACARKLLTVVWSVVKNDRPYTDDLISFKESWELADKVLEEIE